MRGSIITDEQVLRRAVERVMETGVFAFDTETMNSPRDDHQFRLDPRRNLVFWISVACQGFSFAVPMGHPVGQQVGTKKEPRVDVNGTTKQFTVPDWGRPPVQLEPAQVFDIMRPMFYSDTLKIGHNVKFDLESIQKYYGDVVVPPDYFDTMIAAQLLNENQHEYKLGKVVAREFGYVYDKSLAANVEKSSYKEAGRYAHLDAKYTWLLYRKFEPLLREQDLDGLYALEMDVLEVLLHMEREGALLDVKAAETLKRELGTRINQIKGELFRAAGREINFNSDAQMRDLLFGKKKDGGFGLKPKMMTKGGKDKSNPQPSTSKDALALHIDHPFVEKYAELQVVDTLHSNFLTQWLGGEVAQQKGQRMITEMRPALLHDNKLHANFKQTGTVTGRFSCVASDSLIDMPRDLTQYPGGVPITEVQAGDWVYAFDWQRELTLRRVKWVGQTGVKQTVVVTVRNSAGHEKTLRLTPEHLVRLWNGDWRSAGSLMHRHGDTHRADGPRVMTMVKRTLEDGYVRFYPHAIARSGGTKGGGKSREHRWVAGQLRGKSVSTKADVHHVDGNRANNHPSNLKVLSVTEHRGRRHLHPGWGERAGLHESPAFYDGPMDYRVVSVSPGLVEPVWDMEVEEDHNFIANGYVVHNCSNPNLQNIPRPGTDLATQVRGLFIAPEGHSLIVADYGQIEYIVMAHLSRDRMLVQAFKDGIDLHQHVAAMVFNKDMEDVTKAERTTAKNTNFAVAYGAGDDKVAAMSKISLEQAVAFRKNHRRMLPTLYKWTESVVMDCRRRRPPHVTTLMGRKRRLPTINSSDWFLRSEAERQAVNTVVQGSAADIIKLAMVRLHRLLDDEIRLSLSVHDELVVVCPNDRLRDGRWAMREAMLGPGIQSLLTVPMKIDLKIVQKWSDAK